MNAQLSGTAVAVLPWYRFWISKKIHFQYTFDEGGKNLEDPYGAPGRLHFIADSFPDANGNSVLTGFTLKCELYEGNAALNGVRLSPRGSEPYTGLKTQLPLWRHGDQGIRDAYDDALEELKDLLMDKSVDPGIQRLEAMYPVPTAGGLNIDLMRVVVIPNALVDGSPWSLVTFSLLDGPSLLQDGGGSGPPLPF